MSLVLSFANASSLLLWLDLACLFETSNDLSVIRTSTRGALGANSSRARLLGNGHHIHRYGEDRCAISSCS